MSKEVIEILEKYLPPSGAGTAREKQRMNLTRELSILVERLESNPNQQTQSVEELRERFEKESDHPYKTDPKEIFNQFVPFLNNPAMRVEKLHSEAYLTQMWKLANSQTHDDFLENGMDIRELNNNLMRLESDWYCDKKMGLEDKKCKTQCANCSSQSLSNPPIKREGEKECEHPIPNRSYVGEGYLKCGICNKEFK